MTIFSPKIINIAFLNAVRKPQVLVWYSRK